MEYQRRSTNDSAGPAKVPGNGKGEEDGFENALFGSREEWERKEDNLKQRLRFENLLITLSARFLSIEADKIDGEIQRAIQRLGKTAGADRAYLFLFSEKGDRIEYDRYWCSDGVAPLKEKFADVRAGTQYQYFFDTIKRGETLYLTQLENLPESALKEKQKFLQDKIRSIIVTPMIYRDFVSGGVGFDFVKEEKIIPNDDLALFRMIGDILAGALGRLQSETELIQGERRYKEFFERSAEAIYQSTPDGRFIMVNPAFARLFGYNSTKEMLKAVTNIAKQLYVYEEEREAFKRLLIEKGEVKGYKSVFRRKDGSTISVSSNARVVREKSGKIHYFEGTMRDMSDRKGTDRSKKGYELLMKNAREIMIVLDEKGRIVEANQAALSAYGYDRNTLLSLRIEDLQAPHTRESVKYHLAGALEGGILIETEHARKGGTIFPVEVSSRGEEIDDEKLILSVIRDISERKKGPESSEGQAKDDRKLVDHLPVAAFAVDKFGKIIAWNKAMERMTGVMGDEMLGKGDRAYSAMLRGNKLSMLVDYALQQNEPASNGYVIHRREESIVVGEAKLPLKIGGEERRFLEMAQPIHDDFGNIVGAIEIMQEAAGTEKEADREEISRDEPATPELSSCGAIRMDGTGSLTHVNHFFASLMGYDAEEMQGRPLEAFLFPEDAPAFAAFLAEAGKDDEWALSQRFRTKNGETLWCSMSGAGLAEGMGASRESYVILVDITPEKRRSEESWREAEQYRELIDRIPNCTLICIPSEDGKGWSIEYANDAVEVLEEKPREELAGKEIADLFPDAEASGLAEELRRAFDTGRTRYFTVAAGRKTNGGDRREFSVARLKNGKVMVSYVFRQEISSAEDDPEQRGQQVTADPAAPSPLFRYVPVGAGVLNADGIMSESNAGMAAVTGFGEEELDGKSLRDLCCNAKDFAKFQDLLRKGSPVRGFEIPLRKKNGTVYIASLDSEPIPGDKDRSHVFTISDVTEKRKGDEALRLSERKYRKMFENAVEGIFQSAPSGRFVSVNPSMARIFGYDSPGEMIRDVGDIYKEVYVDPERGKELDQLLRLSGVVEAFDAEVYRKDGSKIWVSQNVRIVRDESGNVVYHEGTVVDITDHRRISEDAGRSGPRHRVVLDLLDTASVLTDGDTVTEVNAKARELFGTNGDEQVGRKITEVLAFVPRGESGDALSEYMRRVRESGSTESFTAQYVRPDGTRLDLQVNVALLEHLEERLLHIAARDISEQVRAEYLGRERMEGLRESMNELIGLLSYAVESRDPFMEGHQKRVASLATAIAAEMGLPEERILTVRYAGALHDVGKLSVPTEILSKIKKLSDIEYSLFKIHASAGYETLVNLKFPYPVAQIVLQHHERVDGSGYPAGLRGDEILLESKILAVADVVEAMALPRPYRAHHGIDVALGEITANRGSLYDENAVDACVRLFREKGYTFEEVPG